MDRGTPSQVATFSAYTLVSRSTCRLDMRILRRAKPPADGPTCAGHLRVIPQSGADALIEARLPFEVEPLRLQNRFCSPNAGRRKRDICDGGENVPLRTYIRVSSTENTRQSVPSNCTRYEVRGLNPCALPPVPSACHTVGQSIPVLTSPETLPQLKVGRRVVRPEH